MSAEYNRGFTNGLAVGIALNGKIIQPMAMSNIWKYARDQIILSNLSLIDDLAIDIDTHTNFGPCETLTLTNLSLSDDCSVEFI
jgi:hypothetical protein